MPCTILKLLGSGSYGNVYQLKFHHGREYALKIISLRFTTFEDVKGEGEIMMRLEHPHVVQCCNVSKVERYLGLLLEFCSHGSLKQEIYRQTIAESCAIKWFAQMADAIQYLHRKHVIHRDIKPENILLDKYKYIKISDFGFSKEIEFTVQKAKTHCGTDIYMSPQIWNDESYSNKTDVWSLGCVFYEVLARQAPFSSTDSKAIMSARKRALPSGVNGQLQIIIDCMLRRDEESRPTARDIFDFINKNLLSEKYVRAPYVPLEKVELDINSVKEAIHAFNSHQLSNTHH